MTEKGSWTAQELVVAQLVSPDEAPKAWRHPEKFPSWTLTHLIVEQTWEHILSPDFIGKSSWAVMDSSSTTNVVMPQFIEVCSLDVGPWVTCQMVPWV